MIFKCNVWSIGFRFTGPSVLTYAKATTLGIRIASDMRALMFDLPNNIPRGILGLWLYLNPPEPTFLQGPYTFHIRVYNKNLQKSRSS